MQDPLRLTTFLKYLVTLENLAEVINCVNLNHLHSAREFFIGHSINQSVKNSRENFLKLCLLTKGKVLHHLSIIQIANYIFKTQENLQLTITSYDDFLQLFEMGHNYLNDFVRELIVKMKSDFLSLATLKIFDAADPRCLLLFYILRNFLEEVQEERIRTTSSERRSFTFEAKLQAIQKDDALDAAKKTLLSYQGDESVTFTGPEMREKNNGLLATVIHEVEERMSQMRSQVSSAL